MDFPFSAGVDPAGVPLPSGACDCHIHVYDSRYPAVPGAILQPPDASIADYLSVQARMGTKRAVLVTPSTYGTDNAPMLDGLALLGVHGRGVAVIDGSESDAELARLHAAGVRGVRINLSLSRALSTQAIARIADRIAPRGWHLQLLMPVAQLAQLSTLLRSLPVELVFDHFARLGPEQPHSHPAHRLVLDLLSAGRAWIKLSGGYLVSPLRSVEDPALDALARSFIGAAPNRVVWGSDWPHATASAGHQPLPDDARQVERLAQWAGDAATLAAVLVDNPQRLYGFEPLPQD
ncbi:amidohydrolase family protein [Ramlibacter sp. AW1]|uniref:Amidohydrolase family protein n=1 Tax=Ramlibacter aurantiacus TaxID=2801330 RepID=A0A936ZN42_9BURK|nr:amidohydrolase family protein [Ramlibacter aurantiacus]MBL0419261.1 amidohydrolase family protein [Ramlibacter aurantiacus]